MKIAIYYIVTGDYKCLFNDFYEHLLNFFPGIEKHLIILSDSLICNDIELNDISITYHHINHYPWPIITLYKHYHILTHLDETCDYHVYFNADSIINKNDPSKWFNKDKINISYHASAHYPVIPYAYEDITLRSDDVIQKSVSFNPDFYEYVQGGFFMANTELTKKFCEDICDMLDTDMGRGLFAEWHDEGYVNKWVYDNKDLCNISFLMSNDIQNINERTFIYILQKTKKSINNNKKTMHVYSENYNELFKS